MAPSTCNGGSLVRSPTTINRWLATGSSSWSTSVGSCTETTCWSTLMETLSCPTWTSSSKWAENVIYYDDRVRVRSWKQMAPAGEGQEYRAELE